MPYKELGRGYNYNTDEQGSVSGTRTFIVDSGGGIASLPVRGTSLMPNEFGVDIPGCLARQIRVQFDGDDRDPQYVVVYDTRSQFGVSGAMGITNDEANRSFDVQPELMSIDSEAGGWTWDLQAAPIDAGIAIFKRSVLQDFSMAKAGLSTTAKNTLLTKIRQQAGTINASAFEGFAVGQVYFNGSRGGNYKDQSGVERWNIELLFTARLLTDEKDYAGAAITQDDWLYLYIDQEGAAGDFDKPKRGSAYLYRKTDFSSLVS